MVLSLLEGTAIVKFNCHSVCYFYSRVFQEVVILRILVAVCIYLTQIKFKLKNTTLFFEWTVSYSFWFCWYSRSENIWWKRKIWKKGEVMKCHGNIYLHFLIKCLKQHDSNFAFEKIAVTENTPDSVKFYSRFWLIL